MAKARALPLLFTGAAMCFAANAQAAVTISTDATKNESCSAGVCTPTAKSANLNAGDLQRMLAASDVVVKTGSGATSINVLTTLAWTSTSHLSLDAIDSIHVQAPVVVAGTGALTLITNDGGAGGD